MRKVSPSPKASSGPAPVRALDSRTSSAGGALLDATVRRRFEPLLGFNFANVRIFADEHAANSARAVGADAFTRGADVFFDSDRYQPRSDQGRRLLAHELAHIVQQHGSARSTSTVSRPEDAAEIEADQAADALMSGRGASLEPGSSPVGVHRQPKKPKLKSFAPEAKRQLRELGRGELDELIDKIVADGSYHRVRTQTTDGVEHVYEVKTEVGEKSEAEEIRGGGIGGALTPEAPVTSTDGKKVTHRFTYMLRVGPKGIQTEIVLHELIHLRIAIDRTLPSDQQSSFFKEYAKANEMTEVMAGTTFGDKGGKSYVKKSSYGALPILTGHWEKVKLVLKKIEEIRGFFANQDAAAALKFDAEPTLAPAALIEFLTQEKYVTQTAAKAATKGVGPSNETVATRYARTIVARFNQYVSAAARTKITTSPVGKDQLDLLTDGLRLNVQRLYDAIDASSREATAFEKNPPKPPANMPDPKIFESRPVDIKGRTVPGP